MELREIEGEIVEQREEIADISLEVEAYKAHAERVEVAVHALIEAHSVLRSEGVQMAIDHAMQARWTTDDRLRDLRTQKENLLERNQELLERCKTALERKRFAYDKLPDLCWGPTSTLRKGDPGFALYTSLSQMINDSIHRVEAARKDLRDIQSMLERLPV